MLGSWVAAGWLGGCWVAGWLLGGWLGGWVADGWLSCARHAYVAVRCRLGFFEPLSQVHALVASSSLLVKVKRLELKEHMRVKKGAPTHPSASHNLAPA